METNLIIFLTLIVFLYQLYKIAAKAADFLVETTKAAFIFIILLVLFSMYQHSALDPIPPIIDDEVQEPFYEDSTRYYYPPNYTQL